MALDKRRLARRDMIKYGGVIGGAMVAGCFGEVDDDDPLDDDPVDDDSVDDDDADDTVEPDDPETFVMATSQDPASIDPARALDELESILATNVYDSLARYDSEFPPNIVPAVAEDWEAEDSTTWTFQLRDDIQFHNGDQLTADDVVYSVERMMTIGEGMSWLWSGQMEPDAATALGDYEVEIELEQTYGPFESTLPWLFIVNEEQVEAEGDDYLEDNDAGSGPYTIEEYDRGEAIHLSRYDGWYGEFAEGSFPNARFDITREVSTIVGDMEAGEADITDRWLPVTIYDDLDEADGVRTSETTTFNTYFVFLNTQSPPLDDPYVRRAIAWAFDYETAMQDILGTDDPFTSPIPEGIPFHTTDGVTQYEQDFSQAEEEIDQSEYDIEDIEFTYVYQPDIEANSDMGLMMADQLGEVGITVNLEEATWSRIVEISTDVETAPDAFPLWGLIEYLDPDAYMWPHYHSSTVNTFTNGGKYEDEEVDEMLEEARRSIDEDERREIYEELQRRVADDCPAIYVANDVTRYSLSERTGGFADNGIMGYTHQLQNFYEDS